MEKQANTAAENSQRPLITLFVSKNICNSKGSASQSSNGQKIFRGSKEIPIEAKARQLQKSPVRPSTKSPNREKMQCSEDVQRRSSPRRRILTSPERRDRHLCRNDQQLPVRSSEGSSSKKKLPPEQMPLRYLPRKQSKSPEVQSSSISKPNTPSLTQQTNYNSSCRKKYVLTDRHGPSYRQQSPSPEKYKSRGHKLSTQRTLTTIRTKDNSSTSTDSVKCSSSDLRKDTPTSRRSRNKTVDRPSSVPKNASPPEGMNSNECRDPQYVTYKLMRLRMLYKYAIEEKRKFLSNLDAFRLLRNSQIGDSCTPQQLFNSDKTPLVEPSQAERQRPSGQQTTLPIQSKDKCHKPFRQKSPLPEQSKVQCPKCLRQQPLLPQKCKDKFPRYFRQQSPLPEQYGNKCPSPSRLRPPLVEPIKTIIPSQSPEVRLLSVSPDRHGDGSARLWLAQMSLIERRRDRPFSASPQRLRARRQFPSPDTLQQSPLTRRKVSEINYQQIPTKGESRCFSPSAVGKWKLPLPKRPGGITDSSGIHSQLSPLQKRVKDDYPELYTQQPHLRNQSEVSPSPSPKSKSPLSPEHIRDTYTETDNSYYGQKFLLSSHLGIYDTPSQRVGRLPLPRQINDQCSWYHRQRSPFPEQRRINLSESPDTGWRFTLPEDIKEGYQRKKSPLQERKKNVGAASIPQSTLPQGNVDFSSEAHVQILPTSDKNKCELSKNNHQRFLSPTRKKGDCLTPLPEGTQRFSSPKRGVNRSSSPCFLKVSVSPKRCNSPIEMLKSKKKLQLPKQSSKDTPQVDTNRQESPVNKHLFQLRVSYDCAVKEKHDTSDDPHTVSKCKEAGHDSLPPRRQSPSPERLRGGFSSPSPEYTQTLQNLHNESLIKGLYSPLSSDIVVKPTKKKKNKKRSKKHKCKNFRKIFQAITNERRIFMDELQTYRLKRVTALLDYLNAGKPNWYIDLGSAQRRALDGLRFGMKLDMLNGTTFRTQKVFFVLGLHPVPSSRIIEHSMHKSGSDSKKLVTELFSWTYNQPFNIELKEYPLHARTLLSALLHLGLNDIISKLESMFVYRENKIVEKKAKKKNPKRTSRATSPYLEPTKEVRCWSPARQKPQKFEPREFDVVIPEDITPSEEETPPPPVLNQLKDIIDFDPNPKSFAKCDELAGYKPRKEQIVSDRFSKCKSFIRRRGSSAKNNVVSRLFSSVNLERKPRKKRKKFKAPPAFSPDSGKLYLVQGIVTLYGKTYFMLGNVINIEGKEAKMRAILGGQFVSVESTNAIEWIADVQPCDCKKYKKPALKHLRETKCRCGHFYDDLPKVNGEEKAYRLNFFERPNPHCPHRFNHSAILNLDTMDKFIKNEFRLSERGVKKSRRRIAKGTVLNVQLIDALDYIAKTNLAAQLPDIHLVPEIKEWLRHFRFGPMSGSEKQELLRISRHQWNALKEYEYYKGHVEPGKGLRNLPHVTKYKPTQLIADFNVGFYNYKMEILEEQTKINQLLWASMFFTRVPLKHFREVFNTYLTSRVDDLRLINPYSKAWIRVRHSAACQIKEQM